MTGGSVISGSVISGSVSPKHVNALESTWFLSLGKDLPIQVGPEARLQGRASNHLE